MPQIDMHAVRKAAESLRLSDSDLAAGDGVVAELALLRAAIDGLQNAQPWLVEWLRAEHMKGGVLYAAAKVNWSRQQRGANPPAVNRMRATIIQQFNTWALELTARLDQFETGPRNEASVSDWQARLTMFHDDPVKNLLT